jgi:PilZ domain
MNTNYSLPPGTEIQFQLKHEGATLVARGAVTRCEPSMGFGVSFRNMKATQQKLLQKWLDGLSAS